MADGIEKKWRVHEHGFTYIALLIFIAVLGVGLAATGDVWHTALQREKEEELLFAGDQFRNALTLYYLHAAGPAQRYPMSLEDLMKDPRNPATRRYLRKIYLDPMSSSANWGLIKGANGEILGVHSTSEEEPMKKGNFALADQDFEGKKKYSDWVFMISARFIQPSVMTPPATQPSGMNIPGSLMQSVNP